jgi:hypothetical protein
MTEAIFMYRGINLIHLYRNIVKAAKRFPSKKRDKILREIRYEFRKNSTETNPQKIDQSIMLAKKGLGQLSMYSDLSDNRNAWSVTLDQEPMPKPATNPGDTRN